MRPFSETNLWSKCGDRQDLHLELAAFVDGGVYFVNATYNLEGDGLVIFTCYEQLLTVAAVESYQNTTAVAQEIARAMLSSAINSWHEQKILSSLASSEPSSCQNRCN